MLNIRLKTLAVLGAVALLVAVGVVFAACGGSGDDTAVADTAADEAAHVEGDTPSDAAQHVEGDTHEQDEGTEQSVVRVSLTEWSVTGDDGAAQFTAPAGETTFEVHNEGATIHELVIIKTDADPAALPAGTSQVDEAAAGDEIGEVEQFPAGEIETGTFTLEPGTYALICNVPGHYSQGMYAQLVVE